MKKTFFYLRIFAPLIAVATLPFSQISCGKEGDVNPDPGLIAAWELPIKNEKKALAVSVDEANKTVVRLDSS
jgi:hypothetical protein